MKSSPAPQRQSSAPASVSTPSGEALGFDSPTYGTLAAEIAQAGAPPAQGCMPQDAIRMGEDPPMQLLVKGFVSSFKTTEEYKASSSAWDADITSAAAAAVEIDALVQDARRAACNWNTLPSNTTPHTARWVQLISAHLRNTINMSKSPKLLPAAFGYVIEDIVSNRIRGQVIQGLTVHLQVSMGHSRPDIVLRNASGKDVAWLDITASGSDAHIKGKDHSGWKTRPYIAEIQYQSLDVKADIINAGDDPLAASLSAYYGDRATYDVSEVEFEREQISEQLHDFYDEEISFISAKAKKTQSVRDFFTDEVQVPFDEKKINMQVKGAVSALGMAPSKFGFTSATSQDASAFEEHLVEKTGPQSLLLHANRTQAEVEKILLKLTTLNLPAAAQLIQEFGELAATSKTQYGILFHYVVRGGDSSVAFGNLKTTIDAQADLIEKTYAFLHAFGMHTKAVQAVDAIIADSTVPLGAKTDLKATVEGIPNLTRIGWSTLRWKNLYYQLYAIAKPNATVDAVRAALRLPAYVPPVVNSASTASNSASVSSSSSSSSSSTASVFATSSSSNSSAFSSTVHAASVSNSSSSSFSFPWNFATSSSSSSSISSVSSPFQAPLLNMANASSPINNSLLSVPMLAASGSGTTGSITGLNAVSQGSTGSTTASSSDQADASMDDADLNLGS